MTCPVTSVDIDSAISIGGYTTSLSASGPLTISSSPSGAGQIYNNSTAASLVWANTTPNKVAIRVSGKGDGKGDIFQSDTTHDNDGVFARLARLERLMGIMQRDHTLECDYEPMRELGESYDVAIDSAIQQIMDAALHQLKHMEQEYEDLRQQAEMWRALTRDDH